MYLKQLLSYIAPETIIEREYTHVSDWWAVGIIFFEMIRGEPPFLGDKPEEIFHNILNKEDIIPEVGYNDDQISPEAASLISGLLNRDPKKRLGFNGAEEIKHHDFFNGVHWDNLRKEEPPFVPQTDSVGDTSYFSDRKQFSAKAILEKNKIPKQRNYRRNSSLLGFKLNTTNVLILAEKNKEDAHRALARSSSITTSPKCRDID